MWEISRTIPSKIVSPTQNIVMDLNIIMLAFVHYLDFFVTLSSLKLSVLKGCYMRFDGYLLKILEFLVSGGERGHFGRASRVHVEGGILGGASSGFNLPHHSFFINQIMYTHIVDVTRYG